MLLIRCYFLLCKKLKIYGCNENTYVFIAHYKSFWLKNWWNKAFLNWIELNLSSLVRDECFFKFVLKSICGVGAHFTFPNFLISWLFEHIKKYFMNAYFYFWPYYFIESHVWLISGDGVVLKLWLAIISKHNFTLNHSVGFNFSLSLILTLSV